MKALKRLYSIYGTIIFIVSFGILLPFFIIIIPNPKWHRFTGILNYIWAKAFFMMCLIPVKKEFKGNIKKDQNYIFCSNHFSYLDIPTMGLSPWYFKFTGKKSITRVPIFGYMFKNLHITVDRENQKGRYEAFYQYGKNLDQGVNLSIFPEGGIRSSQPPRMARFKHGPFKVAIEKQVPVVPVTLPFNWIILPDDGKFLLTWHVNKIIYHEPIETKGLSEKDTDALKDQVYKVIDQELRKQNNHEN